MAKNSSLVKYRAVGYGQSSVAESKRSVGWMLVAWMAKLGFAALAIAAPCLGMWIGSSLATAADRPVWVPLLVGGLCFPILPIAWEAWGTWRRRRRGNTSRRILTLFDRLLLRTLTINVVFVGGLLASFPTTVFSALSERGDWMLEGRDAPWAQGVRDGLHAAADRMQWLHEWTHPNAYEELIDPDATGTDEEVSAWGEFSWQPSQGGVDDPADVFQTDAWPFEPELHPLVLAIQPDDQDTPQEVGAYFAQHETDPMRRLKAVHDYVANRTAYDVQALRTRNFPPQDAQTVLDSRIAVCAGYAQLVQAIGEAAGLEVVVVVGKTRGGSDLGHAWNAAKLDGKWYLLDATWDAGSVDGDTFTKSYGTRYLMTPPDAFLYDHFPEQTKWQLRDEPMSFGDFLRRPDLEPSFFAYGFELVSPTRSSISTKERSVSVVLKNPNDFEVHAQSYAGESWDGESSRCTVEDRRRVECPLANEGPNLVVLFGPDNMNMGQVLVTAK